MYSEVQRETVTVLLGLQYGDEAKAKCSYTICERNSNYFTHVVRFNGGPNAGHTIYHKGKKFVTHQIPVGIFFDKECIIGPNSVVDIGKLIKEIQELSIFLNKHYQEIVSKIKIDKRTHVIKPENIEEDKNTNLIGTTNSGIGQTYAQKALRTGLRYEKYYQDIQDDLIPKPIDILDLLYDFSNKFLFEGAQGWGLDINFGDYPYVTSSNCGIAGVIASGVRPDMLNYVIGIAKIYETYVGLKPFQDTTDPDLLKLQEIGQEIGATTGRLRQTNYLDLDKLIDSIIINKVNSLIINKTDVIEQVGCFKLYYQSKLISFDSLNEMKNYITDTINKNLQTLGIGFIDIKFSDNPYTI